MAFINKVCDKVYVINMEKDTARLKVFDEHMKGIQYDRFNAVNGSKIIKDDRLTGYCSTFCTDGCKGCALSHRSIWDIMIKNNYKHVLIFEDDAIIDADFDRKFNDIWNHKPADYDIIYFGCIYGCADNSIGNSIFKKLTGTESTPVNEFINTTNGSAGTHGYLISLEGAKKFSNKPIGGHIDIQILKWIREYNYNAYYTSTNMVETSQDNGNLSDTYPLLLNSVLRKFTINNLKKPSTLDWGASENLIKLGPLNINLINILLIIFVSILPVKYYIFIFLWLLAEFAKSRDFKNTFRYTILLVLPMVIKYIYF